MDIIENIATRISKINMRSPKPHLEVLEIVRSRINDIDNKSDKVKFLSVCLRNIDLYYRQHLLECDNLKECSKNYNYEVIIYFLQQELQRLGIIINEDTFTVEEIEIADQKINQIQIQLAKLELGQEIVFNNIEELKDVYYLGKRKWYQLLLGKFKEMTLSGIVSETISKGLLEIFKNGFKSIGLN